jgi:hypothetical protein
VRYLICADILALGACETAPPVPPPQPNIWDVINTGLQRHHGHDVRELAAVIGCPDSQRVILGDTVLVWRTDINTPIPNGFEAPTHVNWQCTIEVATDAASSIPIIWMTKPALAGAAAMH